MSGDGCRERWQVQVRLSTLAKPDELLVREASAGDDGVGVEVVAGVPAAVDGEQLGCYRVLQGEYRSDIDDGGRVLPTSPGLDR